MKSKNVDVIVAGGGIGGAVLARLLSRRKIRVLVLEHDEQHVVRLRPEVLWPATVQLLEELLPHTDRDFWGTPIEGFVVSEDQHHLLNLGPDFTRDIGIIPVSSNPNRTRLALLDHDDFEVLRGVEVRELIRKDSGVCGVRARSRVTNEIFEVFAPLTVADDGPRSVLRENAMIEMQMRRFPIEFSCFSFSWPVNTPRQARIILNSRREASGILAFGALPLPGHEAIALLLRRHSSPAGQDEPAVLEDFASRAPAICELIGEQTLPANLPRLEIHWGHAQHYGCPGFAMLGDAAHAVSPAGGQGANMAIADAAALADLIGNLEGTDLIAEYERLRKAANQRSLAITKRVATAFSFLDGKVLSYLLPWLVRRVNSQPQLLKRALHTTSTAFQTSESASPP